MLFMLSAVEFDRKFCVIYEQNLSFHKSFHYETLMGSKVKSKKAFFAVGKKYNVRSIKRQLRHVELKLFLDVLQRSRNCITERF